MKWHEGRMVALDTETTSVDPLIARIVTAAIVHRTPGDRPSSIEWLINPGIAIPAEAAGVHGWTNTRLAAKLNGAEALRIHQGREQQLTREGALFEIAAQAATAIGTETPLVVHNAAYDLTLLETELQRHDIDPLSTRPAGIRGVIDPMVLEKQWDPFRKVKGGCRGGKHKCGGCGATDKTLGSLCTHYGLRLPGAHTASVDAVAAVRLAVKLADLWPDIARLKLPTLHQHQIGWRRDQANSLRAYFDRAGTPHDGIDPGWPLHTSLTLTGAHT